MRRASVSSAASYAMAAGRGVKHNASPYVGSLCVVLGPPGSGKGTYASILARRYNLLHLSTGDIAREAFQNPEHEVLRTKMDAGQLLPDKDMVDLLLDRLKSLPVGCSGTLLDGFPRTVSQALTLDALVPVSLALRVQLNDEHIIAKTAGRRNCSSCGKSYNLADVCDVENDVIMPPILPGSVSQGSRNGLAAFAEPLNCDCGGGYLKRRNDDAPDVVEERLRTHHAEEDSLVEFYAERGVLLDHRVRRGIGDMEDLAVRIDVFHPALKNTRPSQLVPELKSLESSTPARQGALIYRQNCPNILEAELPENCIGLVA